MFKSLHLIYSQAYISIKQSYCQDNVVGAWASFNILVQPGVELNFPHQLLLLCNTYLLQPVDDNLWIISSVYIV